MSSEECALHVLNIGTGDMRLTFDPEKPQEREHAAKIVADMLRRGYAIVVKVSEKEWRRVEAFDPQTCEYFVSDVPSEEAAVPAHRGRGRKRRVPAYKAPAHKTRGVAVARPARGCARDFW